VAAAPREDGEGDGERYLRQNTDKKQNRKLVHDSPKNARWTGGAQREHVYGLRRNSARVHVIGYFPQGFRKMS
jgi:hypothetical protein